MYKVFWTINLIAYLIYFSEIIILTKFDDKNYTLWKFQMAISCCTTFPCTILLWYYGYYTTQIIKNKKF